ncbi:MAG TPA: sigma-70 family RNA polymerase sigma factor [Solirubrobacteraceae bacterium]
MGDDRLVARVRAGDDAAFEAIYDRYARGLLAFCRHMLGSRHEAEDALQHSFASAYRALRGGGDAVIELRPWLYTIARNRCLSALRSQREELGVDGRQLERGSLDGLATQIQLRAELRELVDDVRRLPDDQRAALVLFELGDQSHEEIAAVLGVRREKVKALVFQARAGLLRAREARDASCLDVRQQLATAVGRLPSRGMTRAHVDRCPACAAFERDVRRQRSALAAILPVAPTVGLKASVLGFALGGGGGAAALTGAGAGGGATVAAGSALAAGATTAGGAGAGVAGALSSGAAATVAGGLATGAHVGGGIAAKGLVAKILAVVVVAGGTGEVRHLASETPVSPTVATPAFAAKPQLAADTPGRHAKSHPALDPPVQAAPADPLVQTGGPAPAPARADALPPAASAPAPVHGPEPASAPVSASTAPASDLAPDPSPGSTTTSTTEAESTTTTPAATTTPTTTTGTTSAPADAGTPAPPPDSVTVPPDAAPVAPTDDPPPPAPAPAQAQE